jgi:ferredoxin
MLQFDIKNVEEFMADKSESWPNNAPGKFYVDKTCIACDACVLSAPNNFKMNESDGHAYLSKQPEGEEEAQCKEAMEGCPVEAIGNDGE